MVPIFASSIFFSSGGGSFTSLSGTILGGVNFAISTFGGGGVLGGGGGGGTTSGFFSTTFSNCTSCATTILVSFFLPITLAKTDPKKNKNNTDIIEISAVTIRLLYVLRRSYAPY